MPLFQEAIIKKHLSAIDQTLIDSAYSEYKRVYSPEKIKNIKVAKEEQYQEGFIKDVFGAVLGYSVYPESPFNIETERRNETNAKKADGAILKDEKVVGVIELKDNKTKNLDSVKDQAFGYKNNHKECSYVISSNFHKLRFYIDDATEYEEFDLYNLDKETFKRFYLYLRKEGLLDKNLPKLLRQETKFHEEEISKKLYKDYTGFKQSFFENAVKNNAQYDKLLLFKKSQKFLDRILFLLFAEDKGLVGTNSIVKIVEKWSGADDDYYRPLYEMVNTYFGHLYRGYTYQKTGEVIPQFGGELFAPDEVLEVLTIDDAVLKNDLLVLSKYDFNTDVDVNILGHIFEHSLNEVDDVEASLRGETADKTKSKRKKDGVFYTPKYITKYIVDNTLGKLCAEKKAEMKLDGDIAIFEYQKADGKLNEKGKELYERLNAYKAWLLTVKVCDPACGSGAFLNQALSFFIDEHRFIDDLVAELTNTPLRLFDTDLQILENNIYGVDINEESVEIAKLSLWLRTAQPGRKLSDLSANIKCGNSLIDDPAVAGDKAFNWQEQFPTVFEKGGFDVVIGNPPYVNFANLPQSQRVFFQRTSKVCKNKTDLYAFFIEKSTNILNNSGLLSFIIPHTWVSTTSFLPLRELIYTNYRVDLLVDLNHGVFQDAIVKTVILAASKGRNFQGISVLDEKFNFRVHIPSQVILDDEEKIINLNWNNKKQLIENKLFAESVRLDSILKFTRGIKTSDDKRFLHFERKNDEYKKIIRGRNIKAYRVDFSGEYIWYRPDLMKEKAGCLPHSAKLFEVPEKLITQRVNSSGELLVAYDDNQFYFLDTTNVSVINKHLIVGLKYLLVILNSKLINWWFNDKFKMPTISGYELHQIPIKVDLSYEGDFKILAERKLILEPSFRDSLAKLYVYISNSCRVNKLSLKLESWHNLTFPEFIKELNKAIKASKGAPLTKKDEFEWMELFEENKKKVLELKAEIDKTDHEIDRMVYALYGLTEEEIRIVESA